MGNLEFIIGYLSVFWRLYIFAKAELAQYLIADAWHKNLQSNA